MAGVLPVKLFDRDDVFGVFFTLLDAVLLLVLVLLLVVTVVFRNALGNRYKQLELVE